MGCASSNEARGGKATSPLCSASSKAVLCKFRDEMGSTDVVLVTGTTVPSSSFYTPGNDDVAGKDKFKNWAGSVTSSGIRKFAPKNEADLKEILSQARGVHPMPQIRCVGAGHSWSPVFANDGDWLIEISSLDDIHWDVNNNPTQVTVGPGCTTGKLAIFLDSKERGKWRGMYLPANVILETVTYGGVINMACHGTGNCQTIPDFVVGTTIMKWDGTSMVLKREDDPEGFAMKILHFGLLGISTSFTLQLDAKRTAIKVTNSKVSARDLFLEIDSMPAPGGPNPLRDLWSSNYAAEVFYLPASSLKITDPLSNEYENQRWDPLNDTCAIKTFQRTENAVLKTNDGCCGAGAKGYKGFDDTFSLGDFLRIHLGTRVALDLIAKFGDKPSLVAFYSSLTVMALEPTGKSTGKVSYETTLAEAVHWQKYIQQGHPVLDMEVCIKCDDDFTSVYKAFHAAVGITKTFAEDRDTLPLNVALEMRFTKHSDSPMSPAYGKEGDVFCWMELLSSVETPKFKEYCTEVAGAWLEIKLKDGTKATRPHWAKWDESFVANATTKLKQAFTDRLPALNHIAHEADPNGIFRNDLFKILLA